jgi:hypothetical protein
MPRRCRRNPLTGFLRLLPLILLGLFGGCSNWSPGPSGPLNPVMTSQQVATVRQTFPFFQPEEFTPGVNPSNPVKFTPNDFEPAQFFGPAQPQGMTPTPSGILLETNGYDLPDQPLLLGTTGTYFDRVSGQPYQFSLGKIVRSPLNILEERMGVPDTPDAPTISIDLRNDRIDPAYVDNLLFTIRSQLAIAFPQIMDVDPRNCEVVIEPSVFYVHGSNYGNTWAGGLTEYLGGGRYRIHLEVFYISGGTRLITNWADYMVDEATNFYVASIGRPDLER